MEEFYIVRPGYKEYLDWCKQEGRVPPSDVFDRLRDMEECRRRHEEWQEANRPYDDWDRW